MEPALHVRTPLIESAVLSQRTQCRVLLKLENAQPSLSFKIRGVGRVAQLAASRGVERLISSSGGNAGMAAAYAGRQLGLGVTVVVPETTSVPVRQRLGVEGAEVVVHGSVWNEADAEARDRVARDPAKRAYVHPFDDPELWRGHATIVDEIAEDLRGQRPDVVALSVGGGGLFCGVVEGVRKYGWENDVKIVTVETIGADCLNRSLKENRVVTLPDITSVAKTLGSLGPAAKTFEYATDAKPEVASFVVSDAQAVRACVSFFDHHKIAVEPACGAALAAVYEGDVLRSVTKGKTGLTIVVVVCGGGGVSLTDLVQWENKLARGAEI